MPSWVLFRPAGPAPEFTKVMLTAGLCGVELEVKQAEGVEKVPEPGQGLLSAPEGRFPVLQTPQGQLFGSQAICRFLAKTRPQFALHGDTFHEQGEVDSWLEFLQNELEVSLNCFLHELQRPHVEQQVEVEQEAKRDIVAAMRVLDNHLLRSMYLVGHHPTLADLCAQAALKHIMKAAEGLITKDSYRNLHRWFATLEGQTAGTELQ
uniref:GST C-terminal domain-containing protein n=1 Tax=Pyrodinium bahamense TaxID=73915 RepID=A0A7S0A460_9DINO|mmetsp:Transcript_21744/g.60330  ORF Transcript_21744/g.60330 Transcript_21744/m.60330 type:complete len:207 (+) Transcript_21744:64-684(+)